MGDTSVRIKKSTRDRLAALAETRGQSLRDYLDQLAEQEEHQALLGHATAAFDAAVERSGFKEAFDQAFGGLPETQAGGSHSTSRAA